MPLGTELGGSGGFPLVDETTSAYACHTNTYAPIFDGPDIVGYTGVLITVGASTSTSLRFLAALGGQPLHTTAAIVATVEIWDNDPAAVGAIQLYTGDFLAIPASTGVVVVQAFRSNTQVWFDVSGAADLLGPRVLTNWHVCVPNINLVPPPPPIGPPISYTVLDPANYTLTYR